MYLSVCLLVTFVVDQAAAASMGSSASTSTKDEGEKAKPAVSLRTRTHTLQRVVVPAAAVLTDRLCLSVCCVSHSMSGGSGGGLSDIGGGNERRQAQGARGDVERGGGRGHIEEGKGWERRGEQEEG